MRDGALDAGSLSLAELAQLRRTAHEVVPETTKYQEARVQGRYELSPDGARVQAELELRGRTAPLNFAAVRTGGVMRAGIELTPSRFAIKAVPRVLSSSRCRREPSSARERDLG